MFDYCLFLAHWSLPAPAKVATFLFIFVFFSVLFSLEIGTRLLSRRRNEGPGDAKNASPANPRVEAICDGVRRKTGSPDKPVAELAESM